MLKKLCILLLPFVLYASTQADNIWIKVGKLYNLEPRLLYSIAKVESDLDRYVVAFSFNKMSPKQVQELSTFLTRNRIESRQHTQVIAIRSKNKQEASKVVAFLYTNNYPRFDMGIMQINSIHKPLLDKAGLRFDDLFEPKINIQVGAYILATCFAKHKSHKDAINAYNGRIDGNPYSEKVLKEFKKLYGEYQSGKTQLSYKTPWQSNENIWIEVGNIYSISPGLLYSIAKVESDLDRYVVALHANQIPLQKKKELNAFLTKHKIKSNQENTQIITIHNKSKEEATYVVDFLSSKNFPHFDMGIMQINSVHKPLLDKADITFKDLFDPKMNIQVGAYILATCFEKYKNNEDAINAYNGKINDKLYSEKVLKEFKKLYGSYQSGKTKLYYKNPS